MSLPSSSPSALPSSEPLPRRLFNYSSYSIVAKTFLGNPTLFASLFVLPLLYYLIYSSIVYSSSQSPIKASLMSWTSRFGSWGGRFSPFGRPEPEYDSVNGNRDEKHGSASSEAKVTDGDFSYITSADLAAVDEAGGLDLQQRPVSTQGQHDYAYKQKNQQKVGANVPFRDGVADDSSTIEAASPNRETDILVLKHRRVTHPIHFPAFSIAHGELRVGEIRSRAAQRLKVHAPRKVKLLFRGRNLRDDGQTARDAGLTAGVEIMCIVGGSESSGRNEGRSFYFEFENYMQLNIVQHYM